MTHALIIGGGIAGPVTAIALQRAGIESVVYEAHADSGGEGGRPGRDMVAWGTSAGTRRRTRPTWASCRMGWSR